MEEADLEAASVAPEAALGLAALALVELGAQEEAREAVPALERVRVPAVAREAELVLGPAREVAEGRRPALGAQARTLLTRTTRPMHNPARLFLPSWSRRRRTSKFWLHSRRVPADLPFLTPTIYWEACSALAMSKANSMF